MSLKRWLSVFLMLGLILALSPLGAQAEPHFKHHPRYHHPHGKAHGWHKRHARGHRHAYRHWREKHYPRRYVRYVAPPAVTYVQPVAPLVAIQPYPAPQPLYSQPAAPSFSAQFNFGF